MHGETRNWWELCALIIDSWSVHFPRRLVYDRRGKVTAQEAGVRHACFTVPRFLFSSWQCTPTCFSNCFAFLSCLSLFLFLSSSTYIYLPLIKESHFQRWDSALVYTPPEWKHQVPKVNPLHCPLQELHKTQCKNIKKKKKLFELNLCYGNPILPRTLWSGTQHKPAVCIYRHSLWNSSKNEHCHFFFHGRMRHILTPHCKYLPEWWKKIK